MAGVISFAPGARFAAPTESPLLGVAFQWLGLALAA